MKLMINMDVSIIVPVYNVEEYLGRCVNSLLEQSHKNIEIILVDDGSPDRCPQMCDEYAKQYANVTVIHKKNGGLASARNAGLDIARGKYVLFCDSDDWIDPQTVEELLIVAEKYQVDFVRFRPMFAGWPNHIDGELCDFGTEDGLHEGVYNREEIEREIFPRLIATPELSMGVIVSACRSLYLRSFLEENNLRYDEEIRYSEDSIFSAKLVYMTKSFYYLDGPRYYHYYYNPSSITKSFKKDRWDSCKKLIEGFNKAFAGCEIYNFDNQLYLEQIFCVMQALSQRKLLKDKKEREDYCKSICNDTVTIEAFKHIKLVNVPLKLFILLLIVKFRMAKILARI